MTFKPTAQQKTRKSSSYRDVIPLQHKVTEQNAKNRLI